ncbi:MAG TPA: VOC family protein, partial [Gemmatimonadales bacterium]|nr:VOC family protein [Gemmatimonadales bacterium]
FDLPFKDGQLQPSIVAQWSANSPATMVGQYAANLRRLRFLAFDIGLQDGLLGGNQLLDRLLTEQSVPHTFQTYEGTHIDRIAERLETSVLPFFTEHLVFDAPQQSGRLGVDLDHVILGVSSLARGIPEFARLTGVVPKRGGRHPGRGTENALVSLGEGHYLELFAPIAPGRDSAPVTLSPAGWALHTPALDQVVAGLRKAGFEVSGPDPGSRLTPDSTLLRWRTAAASGPGLMLAPFFIEWGAGTAHPSTTSPGGCRFVSLELTEPEPARLQALFQAVDYQATVNTGTARSARLTLDCLRGRVTFAR